MNKNFLQEEIVLENERLKLIPFNREYTRKLESIIFDDSVWEFMGMYVRTQQDFKNYIESTIEFQGINHYAFLIFDKQTNEFAGSTRFGNINFNSEKLEIGWTWYGKKHHGTGLNHATKFELLKHCFENIKLRRVQFSADLENLASQRAITKLGAKQEGIFRNNYIDSEGKSKNDVYFSIIREEWEEIKLKNFGNLK
ncbi:GNAT family protein [Flavobacterium aquidurense]|uniref:GNAT family N-acetyltransferase n=1 Tax=Flavobacterium aquidurense TaxID=362413 RepID=UPI00285B7B1A|nr:GNAT family protein [Flavobacterium aquidurense]MDR7370956.1 RimJ/RimL family protein N-acetyltransferase [Flavobacterium aquidurense]